MSKVMHSGVRGANRGCQLFKMIVDGLRMEMASKFVGEHKSGLPLFFIGSGNHRLCRWRYPVKKL